MHLNGLLRTRRLHIVSFTIPFPVNYGGAIDVFYKVKALQRLGIEVILHCFQYDREPAKELEKICSEVHYYPRTNKLTSLCSKTPMIVKSRTSEGLVERLLMDDAPILFEGLHSCFHLSDPRLKNRFKIVRTHNIEHYYYLNLADIDKNPLKKAFFFTEAIKLRKYEAKIMPHADLIMAISKKDAAYFREHYRNATTISAFHSSENVDIKAGLGGYALYHGSLDVGENNEAATFLVSEVFSRTNYPFVIAGKGASKELKRLASKYKHIEIKEDIDTEGIQELIKNAHVNILPTFQSTGIKLKLLNALFNGRHCIVNALMVRGTGLENCAVRANKASEMIEKIEKLRKEAFTQEMIMKRAESIAPMYFNDFNAEIVNNLIFGKVLPNDLPLTSESSRAIAV